MVKEALQHLDNVEVITSQNELAVTVARRLEPRSLGVVSEIVKTHHRSQYELFQSGIGGRNRNDFLSASLAHQYISSSHIRELIKLSAGYRGRPSVIKELERINDEKN